MSARGIVYFVEDDHACRSAFTRLLIAAGLTVQSYASGTELLAHLSGGGAAAGSGCVLTDLRMPGMDGLELQQACAEAAIELPFVFFTGQGDIPSVVSAMRQGAVDFLEKCAPEHSLLDAIDRALQRNSHARAARARREQLGRRFAALTPREREVLKHVIRGKVNKQIAATLGINLGTVKTHRSAIHIKIGVRSVAELVTLAGQVGLLKDPQ